MEAGKVMEKAAEKATEEMSKLDKGIGITMGVGLVLVLAAGAASLVKGTVDLFRKN